MSAKYFRGELWTGSDVILMAHWRQVKAQTSQEAARRVKSAFRKLASQHKGRDPAAAIGLMVQSEKICEYFEQKEMAAEDLGAAKGKQLKA